MYQTTRTSHLGSDLSEKIADPGKFDFAYQESLLNDLCVSEHYMCSDNPQSTSGLQQYETVPHCKFRDHAYVRSPRNLSETACMSSVLLPCKEVWFVSKGICSE